ncbi:MAG: chromosome segregation protein SMC [Deltaproteobacteria bacterium]|jgi:chromosome segregation protein|uniref:Chromosome partition protein Smc n=1 Tax=Candidatus Acidulodesulfobacterium acidiphilum TaxID=2597224 RepID=A0A520XCL5_9DELT|nr:chromosome segregation protein SMC [Deltaproteobacteria bacterium]MDA8299915.1 chromosome segregation protein SMC [Deltaproteobacteria bacterium]RZV38953.1 MAG: chromosome segregation protein SMC [Candidatus Acidulodesulfobacterium acidiphilum]
MHLKYIELFGFKTFPDKIRIPFDKGINVIVGPNGCGKTNIVDAVRFILGEQNLKELRLKSMNDIIFHGSNIRNGSSVALCRGVFENSAGGSFKYKDFSEIMVERRHFKNKETEYKINGISVPYREYLDFFNESGLSKHYSIIDSYKINSLLNFKPAELRLFFEEASGITKYKIQKKSASKKLEAAVNNLLRIGDLLGEVESRLEDLEKSAKKLEEYRLAETEKNRYEYVLYFRSKNKIISDIEKYKSELEIYSAQLAEAGARIASLLDMLTDAKTSFDDIEKTYKTAANEKNSRLIELAKLGSDIEYLEIKIKDMESEITKKTKEADEQDESRKRNAEKLTGLKEKLLNDESNFKNLNEKLNITAKSLSEKKEFMLKAKGILADIEDEILDIIEKSQNGKNKIIFIDKNIKNIEAKIIETQNNADKISAELKDAEVSFSQKNLDLKDNELSAETVKKRYSDNEAELIRLDKEFNEYFSQKNALEKELIKVNVEITKLKEFIGNREGFSEGVKDFLKSKKDYETFPLYDAIEIEPGFENAAAASFGDAVETVILDNIGYARKAIEYINADKRGKIKIFIPGKNKNKNDSENGGLECEVCRELNLVPIKEKIKLNYKNISFEDIGKDFYYCEDKNKILDYIERNNFFPEVNIITDDGSIFTSDGFISAGKDKDDDGANLFINKNKLSEYSALESVKKEELKSIETSLASVQSKIKEHKENKEKISGKIRALEMARFAIESDLKHIKNIVEKSKERYNILIRESANLEKEKQNEYGEKEELQDEIILLESEYKLKNAAKNEEEQKLAAAEKDIEKIKEEETALRIEINSAGQNINFLKKQIKDLEYNLSNYDKRINSLREQNEKYAREINAASEDLSAKRKNIEALNLSVKEADILIKESEAKLESLKEKISAAEKDIERANERKSDIEKKQNSLQAYININNEKLAEIDSNSAAVRLAGGLSEEDKIFIDGIADLSDNNIKKNIEQLSVKILEIGNVNMNAAEEYKTALERFDFLGKQKKDLENSIETLNGIIKKLDAVSKEKFKSSMSDIRQKFKELFVFLFGGGNADILSVVSKVSEEIEFEASQKPELNEKEADAEETQGMEINVQIPGKKFTGINILSQGERVLVAVSLLFAIFLTKKTPFCVIDEVDAPLDFANNARYNKLIEEISNYSQIIMITHNKKTMEVGKNIFGVTSKHPGISGIVSVAMN